jgi:transcriptional regulator with XRE-family HTH domain
MNNFGDVVRQLMERRGLTGNRLSADIGISPTSVSKIVTGASKPKQVTLSRLMKRLCTNLEEEQMVIRAFTGIGSNLLPEEAPVTEERNLQEERERCERFLEVKTQSILFKNSVARELTKAGIPFQRDYCERIYSTDFLIERNGNRIALECRFNVQRDFERAVVTAKVLRQELGCCMVITVTPFDVSDTIGAEHDFVLATPSEAVCRILEINS